VQDTRIKGYFSIPKKDSVRNDKEEIMILKVIKKINIKKQV